jgi:hypothetical protein
MDANATPLLALPRRTSRREPARDDVRAEILRLAGTADREVGLYRVADALLTLDDARLLRLHARAGPFDRAAAHRIARALLRAEGDAGLDGLSLAGLLERAAPGDGADLDALETLLDRRDRDWAG